MPPACFLNAPTPLHTHTQQDRGAIAPRSCPQYPLFSSSAAVLAVLGVLVVLGVLGILGVVLGVLRVLGVLAILVFHEFAPPLSVQA